MYRLTIIIQRGDKMINFWLFLIVLVICIAVVCSKFIENLETIKEVTNIKKMEKEISELKLDFQQMIKDLRKLQDKVGV